MANATLSISQTLTVDPDLQEIQVKLWVAKRPGFPTSHIVNVSINNNIIYSFSPTSTIWTEFDSGRIDVSGFVSGTSIDLEIQTTSTIPADESTFFDKIEATGFYPISGIIPLVDAPIIAVDASLGNKFEVALTNSRTLGNPIGLIDGQELTFFFEQDLIGGHNINYDTKYIFPSGNVPTLTNTPQAIDILRGCVRNGFVFCDFIPDFQPQDFSTPVFWLKGDSLTQDNLGNTFTITGTLALDTSNAKFTSAISRTNSTEDNNDYIVVELSTTIVNQFTSDFTIQFWIRHNIPSTGSFGAMVLDSRSESTNDGDNFVIAIDETTDRLSFSVILGDGSIAATVETTTTLTPNQWYWIQIIRENNVLSINVDGSQEATTNTSVIVGVDRLVFFRNTFAPSASLVPFVGLVEDFQIYVNHAEPIYLPTGNLT